MPIETGSYIFSRNSKAVMTFDFLCASTKSRLSTCYEGGIILHQIHLQNGRTSYQIVMISRIVIVAYQMLLDSGGRRLLELQVVHALGIERRTKKCDTL